MGVMKGAVMLLSPSQNLERLSCMTNAIDRPLLASRGDNRLDTCRQEVGTQ